MKRFWRFLAQYALLGVAVAALVIWLAPTLFGPEGLERARHVPAPNANDAGPSPTDVAREPPDTAPAPPPDGASGWSNDPPGFRTAVQRAAPAVVRIVAAPIDPLDDPREPGLDDAAANDQEHDPGRRVAPLAAPIPPPSDTVVAPTAPTTRPAPPRRSEIRTAPDDSAPTLGSGVLLDARGIVLTNHHVIAGAQALAVQTADGRDLPARIIGSDRDTDLAVLRVDFDGLTPIPIGRSADLAVGDIVLAIGNPFGFGQTVTQGIVSATGRNRLGINVFEDFIQTDAAVNPGNSGGALINGRGELIGINTAIFSRTGGSLGIGFAIPIDLALEVAAQIVEHGVVARGWLGIEVQTITPLLADSFGLPEDARGVLVAGILRGGPADQAGLRLADLIVRVDGRAVLDARDALDFIAARRPGETVHLDVLRGRDRLTFEAVAAQRPSDPN